MTDDSKRDLLTLGVAWERDGKRIDPASVYLDPPPHEYDDDGVCIHCNFDGAEWAWWRHSTYEGRAQPESRMPRCLTLDEREYFEAMRQGPTPEEWAEMDARARDA